MTSLWHGLLRADQRGWRWRMLALHGALLAAPIALWMAHDCFHVRVPGFCLFKAAVGVDCPACGVTRSAVALFRGHPGEALQLQPAGPLVVCAVALVASYLAVVLLTRVPGLDWRQESRLLTWIERVALGGLLIGWVGKAFIN